MRHHGSLVKKISAAHGVSNHLVFTDVSSIGAKVQRSFQLTVDSFQFFSFQFFSFQFSVVSFQLLVFSC